jgi:hypothetical protein
VGASADGIFAAVLAAGLALLASGGWRGALTGGVLLGFALYLSYGLVLAGGLALAVIVLLRRGACRSGARSALDSGRRLAVTLAALAGAGAVVVAFTVAGFWWLTGYRLVVERYYQGWAADRPYSYWVWANLASLVLCAGPVVGPALYRAAVAGRLSNVDAASPRRALALLPFAALAAICVADVTGLSKAEVERIWLPYAIWLLVATAWLPAAHRRWWLAAQALTALAINHALLTGW